FLVVGRNNNDGAVPGLDGLVRFVNIKLHAIEFLQQVIGELDVGLVDLIDQQHRPLAHGEGLPQLALADIVADVGDAGVAELAIAQAANRVILVEALQRLGRRFDVPLKERGLDRLGDFDGENRLAGAGLALDEQRSLQGDGGVDRDLEILSGDVGFSALELHWWWTAPRLAKRRASLGGEGVASKRARCGKGNVRLAPAAAGRQRPLLPPESKDWLSLESGLRCRHGAADVGRRRHLNLAGPLRLNLAGRSEKRGLKAISLASKVARAPSPTRPCRHGSLCRDLECGKAGGKMALRGFVVA